MCVIVMKPAGAETPSLSVLENCWNSNPDGAGVAISCRGDVRISKGFMTFSALKAFYEAEQLDKRFSQAMVFHFRIGTHGFKDQGNTHPFPVCATPEELRALEGRHPLAAAHNGIMTIKIDADKKQISDTGQFLIDCHNVAGGDPVKHWKDNRSVVGWGKLAVLYPRNRFALLGSWDCATESAPGCFFSNLSWRWRSSSYHEPVAARTGAYSSRGGNGYDAEYGDLEAWARAQDAKEARVECEDREEREQTRERELKRLQKIKEIDKTVELGFQARKSGVTLQEAVAAAVLESEQTKTPTTEPAKAEPAKVEPAKAEPSKTELAKAEAELKEMCGTLPVKETKERFRVTHTESGTPVALQLPARALPPPAHGWCRKWGYSRGKVNATPGLRVYDGAKRRTVTLPVK